jgi:hypothetical protein
MDDMPGRFPPAPDGQPPYRHDPRGFFPLDFGRVFELTFSLFRFRWQTLVGVSLLVQIPAGVLSVFSAALTSPEPDWYSAFYSAPTLAELNAIVSSVFMTVAVSLLLSVLVGFISYIGVGALIDAVSGTYVGRPASVWASVRRALSRWATLAALLVVIILAELGILLVGLALGALVLVVGTLVTQSPGLAVFLGLIVFVGTAAALIFVLVRWAMAVQVVMLESAGAMAALGRSWRLVAGSTWRVIGYLLAFGVLVGVIGAVFAAILSVIVNPYQVVGFRVISIDWVRLAIFSLAGSLIGAVLLPMTTIPTTLLYLDLRSRHGERINPPGQGSIGEESVSEQ